MWNLLLVRGTCGGLAEQVVHRRMMPDVYARRQRVRGGEAGELHAGRTRLFPAGVVWGVGGVEGDETGGGVG
ncbi:hypothetical protein DMB38_16905 [Streptomyces sp. WAC 06738]|nr:hypothetical protein DMB38_16905 [Streptomyces sp. WAC 06738]